MDTSGEMWQALSFQGIDGSEVLDTTDRSLVSMIWGRGTSETGKGDWGWPTRVGDKVKG